MKYKILANSDEAYEMAPCSGKVVKALRLLQVSSSYYSDAIRYGIAKEQCLHDWIESEQEDGDNITFDMKPATIGADTFREKVAAVLFPDIVTDDNADDLDHREAEEALDAFMGFIEPRHRKGNAISSWLEGYRQGLIGSIDTGIQTEDLLKKTPTPKTSEP